MSKKLTTKEFIKNAKKAHGEKYIYSETEYINALTKVKILCPIHGLFLKRPHDHITSKAGCIKCSNKEQLTTKSFQEKAKIVHNNLYDYSLANYINNSAKIKIICPIHGGFKQRPKDHLNGRGCIKCSGKYKFSTREFIEKAQEVHGNKYNYDLVNYKNCNTKIIITCKLHGDFLQTPSQHLSGRGCSKCTHRVSAPERQWLNINKIPESCRQITIKLKNTNVVVDGFDRKNKTIYEFYGDYWHGNPKIYNANDINPTNKQTFGDLYNKTITKEKLLKSAGYKIKSIWESDFMKYITIIGVGALGSHLVQFIRNAQHSIKIIDFDKIESKNTFSQFYSKKTIGKNKAKALKQQMNFLFGSKIEAVPHKIVENNIEKLLTNSALVVDCLDNASSREIVQQYVRKHQIPCLHGAISNDGSFGQVTWDEDFVIDSEPPQATETDACGIGLHLPFIAIVSAYLARSVHEFLKDGNKLNYQINPAGTIRA